MRPRLAPLALFGFLALTARPLPAQDVSSAQDDPAFADVGDIDGAIAQATQMIDANPEEPANFVRRGRLYFAKGDYHHAILDFTNVLQNDPANVIALFQRGRAYYRNDDMDNAIPDFDAYLRLRPASAPAYIDRGAALIRQGHYDDAIADESKALQLDPGALFALLNRARAFQLKGNDDRAIADFTQALQVDPKRAATYIARADAREQKGDYAAARADDKAAIKLDPGAAPAYDGLAWQLATCPDPQYRNGKIAVVAAERACGISQWNVAGYLDTLAAAYAESGDFDNAVTWETKFLTYHIPEEAANAGQARLRLYQAHQPYHHEGEPLAAADRAGG